VKYKHNARCCKPLGEFGDFDLYFCKQGGIVIARFGDDPWECKSGIDFADVDKELGEAKRRAIAAGYLSE